MIWHAVGEHVSERVAVQKGVELPGLGRLTVLKPGPTSTSKERVPVFIVDKTFAKRFDVEQTGAIARTRAFSPTLSLFPYGIVAASAQHQRHATEARFARRLAPW